MNAYKKYYQHMNKGKVCKYDFCKLPNFRITSERKNYLMLGSYSDYRENLRSQ